MDRCAHICTNGHVLITRAPIDGKEFCEKCGAEMIDKCPSCGEFIRTWSYGGAVLGNPKYERAAFCKNCGSPYPWTKSAMDAVAELLEEEEQLDDLQRSKLTASLSDIVSETPKTQVAVVRFKKALLSVGQFTAEGLRQFAIDFGCELAKSQLGL
ncbi:MULTISPECIES: DUF2321 domain-containing protein [Eubacteriales]|uniref:DUF2321 domain-containing protein n=1 Tax=Eubacteriales TaxID=186802 RepID=UPI0021D3498E|nr:DUF2321 domain-containing protein [Muriventricola aceti]MCU6702433.1 DUF2321 domain-containing protein [Muriventricola aceti]